MDFRQQRARCCNARKPRAGSFQDPTWAENTKKKRNLRKNEITYPCARYIKYTQVCSLCVEYSIVLLHVQIFFCCTLVMQIAHSPRWAHAKEPSSLRACHSKAIIMAEALACAAAAVVHNFYPHIVCHQLLYYVVKHSTPRRSLAAHTHTSLPLPCTLPAPYHLTSIISIYYTHTQTPINQRQPTTHTNMAGALWVRAFSSRQRHA